MARKTSEPMTLLASEARIVTASVTIQALKIDNRQLTQGVFKQLPVTHAIDRSIPRLDGYIWGWVNYCPPGDNPSERQYILEADGILFRAPERTAKIHSIHDFNVSELPPRFRQIFRTRDQLRRDWILQAINRCLYKDELHDVNRTNQTVTDKLRTEHDISEIDKPLQTDAFQMDETTKKELRLTLRMGVTLRNILSPKDTIQYRWVPNPHWTNDPSNYRSRQKEIKETYIAETAAEVCSNSREELRRYMETVSQRIHTMEDAATQLQFQNHCTNLYLDNYNALIDKLREAPQLYIAT